MAVNCITLSVFLQDYLCTIEFIHIYSQTVFQCANIPQFIYPLWSDGHLGSFQLRTITHQAAGNFLYMYFGEHEYFPQVSMYQKWNGWEYIWFNFSRYLQNSVSLWLCQELRFNNRKVRQTFNEKISLRTQDFNFPETIYYIAIYYCIFSWRRIFFAYSGNTIFKILLKHSAYFT